MGVSGGVLDCIRFSSLTFKIGLVVNNVRGRPFSQFLPFGFLGSPVANPFLLSHLLPRAPQMITSPCRRNILLELSQFFLLLDLIKGSRLMASETLPDPKFPLVY